MDRILLELDAAALDTIITALGICDADLDDKGYALLTKLTAIKDREVFDGRIEDCRFSSLAAV